MATEAEAGDKVSVNVLAMSDEDILKAGTPENLGAVQLEKEVEAPVEGTAGAGGEQPPAEAVAEAGKEGAPKEGEQPAPAATEVAKAGEEGKDTKTEEVPGGAKKEGEAAAAVTAQPGSKEGEAAKVEGQPAVDAGPPNYESFYKTVMAPLKANGKTIELRTPEEAVKLMQMGANYTKRMQELAPARKLVSMLQNNGLMDEGRLSFLIDLDKKNPEAIKKLLKDSGVDPLSIDTTVEPAYLEGSHRVTDEEVDFKSALEELSSTQEGKETIQVINTRWDDSSKELLWKQPAALALIDTQRRVGIYDRIVGEVDRRVALGQIAAGTPFLTAYRTVGDELDAANGFKDLIEKHQGTAPQGGSGSPGQGSGGVQPAPVATRVATPKPVVTNDDRASAASATRTSNKTAQPFVNPLNMADDEFMKNFAGRL